MLSSNRQSRSRPSFLASLLLLPIYHAAPAGQNPSSKASTAKSAAQLLTQKMPRGRLTGTALASNYL